MLNDLCYSCRNLGLFGGACDGFQGNRRVLDCHKPILVKPIVRPVVEPFVRWFAAVAIILAVLAVVAVCWATYFGS